MTLEIEKKDKKNPHLALTSIEHQNGSANKRNVSLLMKADAEITEDIAKIIEKVTGEVVPTTVEKASFYQLKDKLSDAIKKFDKEDYSWSYVEDFDKEYVVFSNGNGLFYTTYETTADSVTVGDTATSVNRVVSYREDTGTLILSEDNSMNKLVQSLLVKSFDSVKSNEKLVDVFKSIQQKGKQMEVDIQKAVETATVALKADLEKSAGELATANALIVELQKSAKDAEQSVRKEKIAVVIADVEKAEEILKATATLDESSFETILKSFQEKVELVEKGDLFSRKSSQEDIEKADKEPLHATLLKQKFAVAQ